MRCLFRHLTNKDVLVYLLVVNGFLRNTVLILLLLSGKCDLNYRVYIYGLNVHQVVKNCTSQLIKPSANHGACSFLFLVKFLPSATFFHFYMLSAIISALFVVFPCFSCFTCLRFCFLCKYSPQVSLMPLIYWCIDSVPSSSRIRMFLS